MKKIFLLILAVTLIKLNVSAQLPDFTQTDCNNVTHHLFSDLSAGKSVILALGAGWCGPCRESDPVLQQAYEEFGSNTCNTNVYLMLFETNTPGEETDCNFGTAYANEFNLTMPVLTNIGSFQSGVVGQYVSQYNIEGIPTFLIITPNTADPAASNVRSITGLPLDLIQRFRDSLAIDGFFPAPPITLTGNLCSEPLGVTLTSGFSTPGVWSTSETTQSINVNQSGTYSITSNGCTAVRYVEFTQPLGVATISSAEVCKDGYVTLDYTIPPGGNSNEMWVYKLNSDPDWTELVPADAGPLTLNIMDAPGTTYTFAVRSINKTEYEANPCSRYSNELTLTVNNSGPTVLPSTLTLSSDHACTNSEYTVTFSGTPVNSILQYYDDNFGGWLDWFPIDNSQFNFTAAGGTSTVNGFPGDRFRVKSADGNCYSLSNEVEIYYLPTSEPFISGPDFVCTPGSGELAVNDYAGQTYTNILWSPGGATTPSFSFNISATTTYSVSVTNSYGCTAGTLKKILVFANPTPVISATPAGTICPGTPVTLNFEGTMTATPCTNDVYGQWPLEAFSFSNCGTFEIITYQAVSGDYSVVNVEAGKYYDFSSLTPYFTISEDIVTITDATGSTVYSAGKSFTMWKASFSGQVRFYTHEAGCTPNENLRMRAAICYSDPNSFGAYSWSPGGETTASITVNPAATTSYSLTYTYFGTGCTATTSAQVKVDISNSVLNTTNITSNGATLNWTAPADPAQWQLRYKTTNNGSKWVDVSLTGDKRLYTLTGLLANQNYIWQIRAKCGNNWTGYSNSVAFRTLAPGARTSDDYLTSERISSKEELADENVKALQVRALPNPSFSHFTITVKSNNEKDPVNLIVTDMYGRIVERRVVNPGQVTTLGDTYRAGTYIAKFIQGEQNKQLKLIKISD